jgi:hypothetical protein
MTPGEVALAQDWYFKSTGELLHIALTSNYGFIAYNGDFPIACIFLYPVTGSDSCLLGLPIANPKTDKSTRSLALDAVIKKAETYAGLLGFRIMHSYASHPAIIKRMEKLGYTVGDAVNVHFVKKVGK